MVRMGRWYSIFILSTVWSGESSAELQRLGETWWKSWLSLIIKLFRAWLSSPLIIRPRGMCGCLCVCYVCWEYVCLCVSVFSIIKYNICILSVGLALLPSLPPCLFPLSLLSFCTSRELIFLRFLWLFLVLVLWQVLQTSEYNMSTLPDQLWNNTHSKKAHQKETSSECIS